MSWWCSRSIVPRSACWMPPFLRSGAPSGDAVLREGGGKSASISLHSNELREHCVSRPGVEDFSRFFNRDGDLQAHCVSRRFPVDPPQRVGPEPRGGLRVLLEQTPPQSVLAVVVGMTPPPPLACPPVALALTAPLTADELSISCARVGSEPLPTDPTRTLASHAALRGRTGSVPWRRAWGKRPRRSGREEAVQQGRRVSSREQGWVYSAER